MWKNGYSSEFQFGIQANCEFSKPFILWKKLAPHEIYMYFTLHCLDHLHCQNQLLRTINTLNNMEFYYSLKRENKRKFKNSAMSTEYQLIKIVTDILEECAASILMDYYTLKMQVHALPNQQQGITELNLHLNHCQNVNTGKIREIHSRCLLCCFQATT